MEIHKMPKPKVVQVFVGHGHRVCGLVFEEGVEYPISSPRLARQLRNAVAAGAELSIKGDAAVEKPEQPAAAAAVSAGFEIDESLDLPPDEEDDEEEEAGVEDVVLPDVAELCDGVHHAKLGRVCRQLVSDHSLEQVYVEWTFRGKQECMIFLSRMAEQFGFGAVKEAFLQTEVQL